MSFDLIDRKFGQKSACWACGTKDGTVQTQGKRGEWPWVYLWDHDPRPLCANCWRAQAELAPLTCFNCGATDGVKLRGDRGEFPWSHWVADDRGEHPMRCEPLDPSPTCLDCWDWLCIPF